MCKDQPRGAPWGLQHPRGAPLVDFPTLGQKTPNELASVKYCYIICISARWWNNENTVGVGHVCPHWYFSVSSLLCRFQKILEAFNSDLVKCPVVRLLMMVLQTCKIQQIEARNYS